MGSAPLGRSPIKIPRLLSWYFYWRNMAFQIRTHLVRICTHWNRRTLLRALPRICSQTQSAPQCRRLRFGKEEEQQNERTLTYKISRSKRYDACSDVVEVAGVEPASESTLTGLSPGADDYYESLPPCSPSRRQTVTPSGQVSFMMCGAGKAYCAHIYR